MFEKLLNTYSNDDHVSHCIYRVIYEDYKRLVTRYFSLWRQAKTSRLAVYGETPAASER